MAEQEGEHGIQLNLRTAVNSQCQVSAH